MKEGKAKSNEQNKQRSRMRFGGSTHFASGEYDRSSFRSETSSYQSRSQEARK